MSLAVMRKCNGFVYTSEMYTFMFDTTTYRIYWNDIEGIHVTAVDSLFPHCCENGAVLAE